MTQEPTISPEENLAYEALAAVVRALGGNRRDSHFRLTPTREGLRFEFSATLVMMPPMASETSGDSVIHQAAPTPADEPSAIEAPKHVRKISPELREQRSQLMKAMWASGKMSRRKADEVSA